MTCVFREAQSDVPQSLPAKLSFYRREFCGILSGALRAHFDSLFGPTVPFRRFYMQPQFRFPRSTVFLMLVILAGVMLAIEKAKIVVQMNEGLPLETVAGLASSILVVSVRSGSGRCWRGLGNIICPASHGNAPVRSDASL